MKILFWQWNAFMQKGIERALKQLNMEYEAFYYIPENWDEDAGFSSALEGAMGKSSCDCVFSVNFAPVVSEVCQRRGVPYVSWIYDSPVHFRKKESFANSCNRTFLFDRGQAAGYTNVRHMPLAADSSVWEYRRKSDYDCDVALVGKLYQSDYSYLLGPLGDYQRGVLEGIIAAQGQVYGGYILDSLITQDLVEELNGFYDKASGGTFQVKREELEYACACEVTGRERFLILALLEQRCRVNLYSKDTDARLQRVSHMGYVDYYSQMPAVFTQAKINLNISLKTIRTGIPLRVLDVLSCGGFLITNYQEELFEHFEPGVDLVVYENIKDLVQKVEYYLQHEEERRRIAEHGKRTVQQRFSFEGQLKRMFEMAEL